MAAQQMIEKAFLPVRFGDPKLSQFLANHVAQRLNPPGQGDPIYWQGDKKVQVIGHYDVTHDADIVPLRSNTKHAKCFVDFIACQYALTVVRVECDEVKRPDVVK